MIMSMVNKYEKPFFGHLRIMAATCFKESLDMFEEPGLMPGANLVQLSRLTAVDQVAGHHHRLKDKNQVDLVVISSWS